MLVSSVCLFQTTSPSPPPPPPPSPPPPCHQVWFDTNLQGGDLPGYPVTEDTYSSCAHRCELEPALFFTFKKSDKSCWCKDSYTEQQTDVDYVSGQSCLKPPSPPPPSPPPPLPPLSPLLSGTLVIDGCNLNNVRCEPASFNTGSIRCCRDSGIPLGISVCPGASFWGK